MMKHWNTKSMLGIIVCIVLTAALAIMFTGCSSEAPADSGLKSFTVTVTDLEGQESSYELSSDKATVGDALQEEGLLVGEEGPYGLYIKAVNGIELDWDRDQKYWAFYIDGEYALTGVDQTELKENAVYSFKPES